MTENPNRPLREGFTTGSCAAAAALACCLWQRDGKCPERVELTVPEGRVCTEMLDLYQVDGITYTRIPASLEGNGARALVNYELLVAVVCCAHA
mgnify:CR=1 FL=1